VSKGKVIGAIVAVLMIGGAVAAFAMSSTRSAEVRVAAVTREDLSITVSASGQVEAGNRVDVYPPTAGILESIEVTEGQRVSVGQVIATMDTAPIEVQVAQADAAYAGAVAQREAVARSAPGAEEKQAAQAAVDAAWSAYSVATTRYEAARAGLGAPSASDIAEAQTAVALAQASADAARAAYDSFYNTVYLPAPEPRDPALDAALAALSLARDQSVANLLTAQQGLVTLLAASDGSAATAAARVARDQAYAAYLGAVAQRDALAKASSVSGALAAADAAIRAAAAARALAGDTLTRAQIVAPVDGIVLFNSSAASLLGSSGLGAGSGGKATVGSSVSPASAPFAVVSFETLAFTAQVDEADITRVKPGMTTLINLDGLPETEFASEVERVGKESVLTPTGGTAFPVYLRFSAANKPVLLGMNGSIEISVEMIGNAVTMPVEALLEDAVADYVYTVRDGRARRTEITIGRLTDTRVEIISGLSEGDEVIVSGVSQLTDGDRVRAE
jgi:multidrug efflux pump subunit AcrA (membrane-fusion protein)